jgi:hypothetical protein
LLAEYESGKDVVAQVKKLVEKEGQSNLTVQIVGGVVLEREGQTEEALAVLSKHEGSLDAYVSLKYCCSDESLQPGGCAQLTGIAWH